MKNHYNASLRKTIRKVTKNITVFKNIRDKILTYYISNYIRNEILGYKSKTNENLNGDNIYKLYKKGILNIDIIETFIRKVCFSIVNDNCNIYIHSNNLLEIYDLGKMLNIVDSVIKSIVNKQICINIMSINSQSSNLGKVNNMYKFKEDSVSNNINPDVNYFENFWKQILLSKP